MSMKKVSVVDLKARLSEYLRAVQRGHSLLVMNRGTPVARVVPYVPDGEILNARQPLGEYPSVRDVPLPPSLGLEIDVVTLLLEERQGER